MEVALYMAPRWPMGLQNGLHIAISVYYGRGIAGNIYCKYINGFYINGFVGWHL